MYLKITARCAEKVIRFVKQKTGWEVKNSFEILLFCDYAECDVPIGYTFSKYKTTTQSAGLKGKAIVKKSRNSLVQNGIISRKDGK